MVKILRGVLPPKKLLKAVTVGIISSTYCRHPSLPTVPRRVAYLMVMKPLGWSKYSGGSSHNRNSRKRLRLPGVPLYWKVAWATYGSKPSSSYLRCSGEVWGVGRRSRGGALEGWWSDAGRQANYKSVGRRKGAQRTPMVIRTKVGVADAAAELLERCMLHHFVLFRSTVHCKSLSTRPSGPLPSAPAPAPPVHSPRRLHQYPNP